MKYYKKLIAIAAFVMALSVIFIMVSSAQYVDLPNSPGQASVRPEKTYVLLTASTGTGDGTAVDLGFTVSQFSVLTIWGGTAPTNIVTSLKGSIDGTYYVTLSSNAMTGSPNMYFITSKPVRYIKGSYDTKSGGDGTTSVTMKVTAGGN